MPKNDKIVPKIVPKSYQNRTYRTKIVPTGTMLVRFCYFCAFSEIIFHFHDNLQQFRHRKRTHIDWSITFAARIRFWWFLHRLKAEIQGFQTVQKSLKTDSCSESYGPIQIAKFSVSNNFAQEEFRSVELIWYDFLGCGTILVRFFAHGTILVRVSYLWYEFSLLWF